LDRFFFFCSSNSHQRSFKKPTPPCPTTGDSPSDSRFLRQAALIKMPSPALRKVPCPAKSAMGTTPEEDWDCWPFYKLEWLQKDILGKRVRTFILFFSNLKIETKSGCKLIRCSPVIRFWWPHRSRSRIRRGTQPCWPLTTNQPATAFSHGMSGSRPCAHCPRWFAFPGVLEVIPLDKRQAPHFFFF